MGGRRLVFVGDGVELVGEGRCWAYEVGDDVEGLVSAALPLDIVNCEVGVVEDGVDAVLGIEYPGDSKALIVENTDIRSASDSAAAGERLVKTSPAMV